MKKYVLLSIRILSIIICTGAKAQEKVDLTELKVPGSPAFTILGLQPSEIARPKTYEALEVSLANSFIDNNKFVLPNNYALEFSPYWLLNHPKLTFEKYVKPKMEQTILFNSSISLATSELQNKRDTSLKGAKLGVGYRTSIVAGKPKEKLERLIRSTKVNNLQGLINNTRYIFLQVVQDSSVSTLEDLRSKALQETETFVKTINESGEYKLGIDQLIEKTISFLSSNENITSHKEILQMVRERLHKILTDEEKELKKSASELENLNKDNYGFFLDCAMGLVIDFPTGDMGISNISKWGVWLTPSYRLKNQSFEFLGVLRYLRNELLSDYTDNFDFGGKIVYQKSDFSISFEAIGRYQSVVISRDINDDFTTKAIKYHNDFKANCNLEYRLSDKAVLSYSLGQNFDINTEFTGNLISVISLNYGIGGPTTDSLEGFK